ncbi:MAG: acyl-CoA dehydrogenase family protein [Peptococcaceae bacterium]|jgi:alkylation response protein AidB-like acyl-CoA dehydrogenase|nr:acyl-CoA dehydrogenase family protein [Peptococcaceae bacterium]
MDFAFSPDQEELRDRAASFAFRHIRPAVAAMEAAGLPPGELITAMGREGFMKVRPVHSSEPGLGHLDRVILLEALSRRSAAVGLLMVAQLMGIAALQNFGGPALQEAFLPPLTAGEMLVSMAITEPTGGSDPAGTATRAVRCGDYYNVSGRKVFITNSHLAGLAVVVVRTSNDPRRGLSVLAVDAGLPGFRAGHLEHKTGLKGCVTGELVFDDVRVPVANLLGNEGDGLAIALKAISEHGRLGNAGVALGVMQAIFEETMAVCADDPRAGEALADIHADSRAARLLTYRAAWLLDAGQRADAEVATAKFFADDASLRSAGRAMTIAGGSSLVEGHPLERCFRDSIPLISADGTGDIQRIVAARSLVGRFD